MLILSTLKRAPLHGYAIAQSIKLPTGIFIEFSGAAEAEASLLTSRWRHMRMITKTIPRPSAKATPGMYHAMLLNPVEGGALSTFSPYSCMKS